MIERQVAEGVRRLIDEERVEEILAEPSRTGSECLRRRLQRNRSDESAASNVSSIARESEPASERRTESASASCPELVFPQNAAEHFTGGNQVSFLTPVPWLTKCHRSQRTPTMCQLWPGSSETQGDIVLYW